MQQTPMQFQTYLPQMPKGLPTVNCLNITSSTFWPSIQSATKRNNNTSEQHPDQPIGNYIINGLTNSFDIGYSTSSLKNCNHNLISATEYEKAINSNKQ